MHTYILNEYQISTSIWTSFAEEKKAKIVSHYYLNIFDTFLVCTNIIRLRDFVTE